jgi:hypothetical protein
VLRELILSRVCVTRILSEPVDVSSDDREILPHRRADIVFHVALPYLNRSYSSSSGRICVPVGHLTQRGPSGEGPFLNSDVMVVSDILPLPGIWFPRECYRELPLLRLPSACPDEFV